MQDFARRVQPLVRLATWLFISTFRILYAADNPVVIENQKPGTGNWLIGLEATDRDKRIKGYASATSVNAGEDITFYVTVTPAQTFAIEIYRVGWYGGSGGRFIQSIGPLNGLTQGTCPIDSVTGMIACSWLPSYTLSTQASWTSGIYLALLKNAAGYQNYIIFVVRNDGRTADLIYQQPVTTYQAYNDYPNDGSTGKSLYDYNSYGPNTITGTTAAAKVSFDRPYNGNGSSHFFYWEVNFVRWIERMGYDVTYSTNVDTHTNGARILNYKGFLSVGHDEYWSRPMYDAAVTARDNRVNLAFFGADAVAWQIRFEPSSTGVPNRVMVCYRDAMIDPNTDPTLETVSWRNPPLNRPEQTLIGVMYAGETKDGAYVPYVVTNSSNSLYANTGLHDNDSVPNLVGYEADRLWSEYPAPNAVPGTLTLLSHSPFTTTGNASTYSNSSIYQAPSGAWVFGAGTMGWPYALDNFDGHTVDTRIQQMTTNILNRFVTSLGDFTLNATPATQSVNAGSPGSFSVTINPSGGFIGNVTFSLSGAPTGVTSSFTPNPATSSSTLNLTVGAATAAGSYPLTITGTSGNLTHTTTATLNVTDFSLSATPATQSVNPGSPASYSVSITPAGGFGNSVTLSLSGAPTGVTASFTPNPATSSSTLNVTVDAATAAGSYPLTITGISGTLTHTTTVTLNVVTPDFSLSATPATQSLNQGSSGSYSVTITPTIGFSGNVTLNVTGAPTGVTASFTPNPATGPSTLNVTVDAATVAGSYPLTITGVSGSLTHTTGVTLNVVAVDFSLSATPSTRSVTAGSSTTYAVTIATTGGFNGSVTLSLSGEPTGVTASFTPNPATTSSTLNLTIDASTALGSYPLTITGVNGNLTHTTSVTLTVTAAPDFSVSATPSTQTVIQGSPTSYSVSITPVGGFSGNVTLSVSGAPTGVTASFTPNPATSSSTLNVTVGAATAVGSYPLTITGVNGNLTHTTTVTLTVNAAPDFSLSATPSTQSVNQGSSTTYSITVTPVGGFTGNVTFSLSGAPTGVTSSFTPNPSASSSTLNVTVGAATAAGSYPLTITGVNGSLSHTTNVTLSVVAVPEFSISATPSTRSVTPGNSTTYAVTITATGGFNGSVTLSLSGEPTGVTSSFTPNPATSSSTLNVTIDAATALGSYPLTITGVSGNLTHTTSVTLTVTTAPDFSISATPPTQSVNQGSPTSYSVSITPVGGFNGSVTLSLSGAPAGVTASFTPNPATASSTLNVTVGTATAVGSYPLTITGVSGNLTHTADVTLTVTAAPDFSLSATPSTQSVNQGSPTSYSVSITPAGGFNGSVTLSLSGAPAGVTASFTPNPATASSTLNVTVGAATAAGSYPLTITGVSGGLTHTTNVTLIVVAVPDFALSATPSTRSVTAGSSTSYAVTITPSNGFNGTVTLSLSGAPAGVTSSFTPNPATASSTLNVTVDATTALGSYPLTITGVSGTLTHTTAVTLTVIAAPDFSISATPPTQSVTQGGSTSYAVTITPAAGFNGSVTLSLSGAPAGVTSSFTPNPTTSSSTLNLTVAAATAPGSYPLTITGVSGTLTHTTAVTLTVTAAPDFSISATPPTQSVTQGGATSYAVTITPAAGFNGSVTLSLSGAPAGVTSSFTPNPTTSSSTLNLTVAAATVPGSYPLTITGVSGTLTHTANVTLVVTTPPDFSLSATPSTQSANQGGSTSYSVAITPANGFNGSVTLSLSGAPAGVTSSFTPNPATSSSTLNVNVGATTVAGSYTLTITGVAGNLTHTTTVTLIVAAVPSFSISATPSTQTVIAGNTVSYTITITPSAGFASPVSLAVTGFSDLTSSFNPNPATGSSTLSILTSPTAKLGNRTLTITGTSGSITRTLNISLLVKKK